MEKNCKNLGALEVPPPDPNTLVNTYTYC